MYECKIGSSANSVQKRFFLSLKGLQSEIKFSPLYFIHHNRCQFPKYHNKGKLQGSENMEIVNGTPVWIEMLSHLFCHTFIRVMNFTKVIAWQINVEYFPFWVHWSLSSHEKFILKGSGDVYGHTCRVKIDVHLHIGFSFFRWFIFNFFSNNQRKKDIHTADK